MHLIHYMYLAGGGASVINSKVCTGLEEIWLVKSLLHFFKQRIRRSGDSPTKGKCFLLTHIEVKKLLDKVHSLCTLLMYLLVFGT